MKNAFRQRYTHFNISIVICFYLMIIISCAELSENCACEDSCSTSCTKEPEVEKNELLDDKYTRLSDTSSPNPEQSGSDTSSDCSKASNYAIEEFEIIKPKNIIEELFNEQKKIIKKLKEFIKKTKYDIDWDILDNNIEFKWQYEEFLQYFDIIRDKINHENESWLLNHDTDLASTFYNIQYIFCIINRLTNDYETKRLDLVQMVCLKEEMQNAIKKYNKMSRLYNFHVEKRDRIVDCFKDLIRFLDMIECIINKNPKYLDADFNGNVEKLTIMEAFGMFDEDNKNSLNSLFKTCKELKNFLTEDLIKTRDSITNFLEYINYDDFNV
ncbi:hypothetical protein NBO_18g0001 [Nosema bombycis CQ1]|uniref:Uncharacterized protein n=1 Tax=Nosema bombycis (strain CQ1 / CVCC 102059) TaxID=578461 RepID=R0M9L7_NOSB1|nr:hypothetical protein NBO_18g0001 [Nosema bombycis CQ1]|eukprot:EOB14674.1 hypothetical protein NBO_18g0001 [Nosema bombycis CQ1]